MDDWIRKERAGLIYVSFFIGCIVLEFYTNKDLTHKKWIYFDYPCVVTFKIIKRVEFHVGAI